MQNLIIDWNLLQDALQSKGIQIIQIFMNLIIPKICEKLKICKLMKSKEERETFENDIEKILEDFYVEYETYSKKYLSFNQKLLNVDKYNMKSLMLENNDIKNYEEDNFPFYKYFLMTIYPSKETFINEFKKVIEHEKKYPILTVYINFDNKLKDLFKFFPEFNDFCNFMINKYSYKITREEASKKLLKDEEIYKNNINKFKDKFNKFKEIWSYLKIYSNKYGCRDEMPIIDLDENKSIAYFLNDNGEIGKGMYIAAASQNFIEWQNIFLNNSIESSSKNISGKNVLKYKKKDIQKAKNDEILNFENDEKFLEIILENSKRNIFTKDNSINYMNYKNYIYDFDSIENILEAKILSNQTYFNDYENLKFVTYCFEGFRGGKSSILTEFIDIYHPLELNKTKKHKIYNYIKNNLNNEINDLLNIYFSLQLLITFLTEDKKDKRNEKDDLNNIINVLPDNINISKECIVFFKNINIKIEELFDVFSYFELLCFKPIIKNLIFYKKEINDDSSNRILKLFDENKFGIITKISLASACRKLISRYLVGTRSDLDIDENKFLCLYLNREEFWPKELWENEEKINEDLVILGKENIIVGQCYELYKLLGGDEILEFDGIK